MKKWFSSYVAIATLVMMLSSSAFANGVNFRFSPIAAAFGIINTDIDIKLGDSFTLGPSVTLISLSAGGISASANAYGIRANYYLTGTALSTNGFYLGPFVNYTTISVTKTISGDEYKATGTGYVYGAYLGYQWMWSTFNINLGGGYVGSSFGGTIESDEVDGETEEIDTSSASRGGFGLEFTLGFAF